LPHIRGEQPPRNPGRMADSQADYARAVRRRPPASAGRPGEATAFPGQAGAGGRHRGRPRGRSVSVLSVSVVICAHTERRWDATLAAAASVRGQSYPAKELIVVVDHNRRLFERLKSALPEAMVTENREQQGLSGGKNTGIAMASGEVVAFLDDDAV